MARQPRVTATGPRRGIEGTVNERTTRHAAKGFRCSHRRNRRAGLAWPNGYRSLHGDFTDERTTFDVSKYGEYVPIVNQDTRRGRPTKEDWVGYLTHWHADKV